MIQRLQDAFALAEQRWDTLFADPRSETLLERLAAEAIAEDDAGDKLVSELQ